MKTRLTRSAFWAAFAGLVTGLVARAQTPAPSMQMVVAVKPKLDMFMHQSQTYTLTSTPALGTSPMVYVNGLLLCQGFDHDYTLTGNVLTFTLQQIGPSPCVQVLYWTAE